MKLPASLIHLASWWNRSQRPGRASSIAEEFETLVRAGRGDQAAALIAQGVWRHEIDKNVMWMVEHDRIGEIVPLVRFASKDTAGHVLRWAGRMGHTALMDEVLSSHAVNIHVAQQTMLLGALHQQWDGARHLYGRQKEALEPFQLTPDHLQAIFTPHAVALDMMDPYGSEPGPKPCLDRGIFSHLMIVGGTTMNKPLLDVVAPLVTDDSKRWGLDLITTIRQGQPDRQSFDVECFVQFFSSTFCGDEWNRILESAMREKNTACILATLQSAPETHKFELFCARDFDIHQWDRSVIEALMTKHLHARQVPVLWNKAIAAGDDQAFVWGLEKCAHFSEDCAKALECAARHNHLHYVKQLLNEDTRQIDHTKALMWASEHGNSEMMDLLWDYSNAKEALHHITQHQKAFGNPHMRVKYKDDGAWGGRPPTNSDLLRAHIERRDIERALDESCGVNIEATPVPATQYDTPVRKRKM